MTCVACGGSMHSPTWGCVRPKREGSKDMVQLYRVWACFEHVWMPVSVPMTHQAAVKWAVNLNTTHWRIDEEDED